MVSMCWSPETCPISVGKFESLLTSGGMLQSRHAQNNGVQVGRFSSIECSEYQHTAPHLQLARQDLAHWYLTVQPSYKYAGQLWK